MKDSTFEDALLLVASVRSALINQVKHYTKTGRLLATEKDIIAALLKFKHIRFDTSHRIQLTTDEEQFAIAKKDFFHRRQACHFM